MKWKFVETLNYMKEGAIFNYTRLTNYTCKILQHCILLQDKVGHKRGNTQCCPYYRTLMRWTRVGKNCRDYFASQLERAAAKEI